MTQNAVEKIAAALQANLPRREPQWRLREWVLAAAGLGGFVISIATLFATTPDIKLTLAVGSLVTMLMASLAFLVYREVQGLDRYTQAIPHLHFAAYITRDALRSSNPSDPGQTVTRLIGSCAEVFSVITGRMCYAGIKLVERDEGGDWRIKTFEVDDLATMGNHGVTKALQARIQDYDFTDAAKYYSLRSLARGSAVSYYLSNDCYKDFRDNRYGHPMLCDPSTGEPMADIKKLRRWAGWPLTFRSTLVVPIRAVQPNADVDLLGFLCIDCTSRNRFEPRLSPDLAGAYADLIFALYHHARVIGGAGTTRDANDVATPVPTRMDQ